MHDPTMHDLTPPTPPGDWRDLGIRWKVAAVTPSTEQADAYREVVRHTGLRLLRDEGPPPGLTADQFTTLLNEVCDGRKVLVYQTSRVVLRAASVGKLVEVLYPRKRSTKRQRVANER